MSDPISRLVTTWVAQLDLARAQSVLRALVHRDDAFAERQLSAVVGSAVRLTDERVREMLADALEARLDAGVVGDSDATSLFPLEPVGAIDIREDDPTDEVAKQRVARIRDR